MSSMKREAAPSGTAIKKESDSQVVSPSAVSEDDIYEDAGDLEFPKDESDVYLMKLPKFLWDRWAHIRDDEEISLGVVRVAQLGMVNGQTKQQLTLKLSGNEINKGLPSEYDMEVANASSTNTFVFTESDIPGLSQKTERESESTPPPSKFAPSGPDRLGGPGPRSRNRRNQPFIRKAAPKKTSMAGIVKHELKCNPVNNEEYTKFTMAKYEKASQPKHTIAVLSAGDAAKSNALQPGTINNFSSSFVKSTQQNKNKNIDLKAARIAQNDLLDLIFECFAKYKYWSMKALKAELKQPEPYLKSTLEQVAELVRSGPFNMHWTLKPENENGKYLQAAEDAAGETGSDGGESGSDEDEEGVEMEDVMPT